MIGENEGSDAQKRMVLLTGLAPKPISQPLSVQTNDTLILIWLRRMWTDAEVLSIAKL